MRNPLSSMRIRSESISNTFGLVRKYQNGTPKNHQGWDLLAHVGTPVYAVNDGRVEFVVLTSGGAYGKQICLKFTKDNKTYYAFYAHLSSITVSQGSNVTEGSVIGFTGKTGNAANMSYNEEHLHFEIRLHPNLGLGLSGRIDPGYILGFAVYACY
jgi:murein DD-endopeptidase MepM/ murein hydrolase activator NlpD